MRSGSLNYSDLIGKPFRDGGRGPDDYDCWGILVEMGKRMGWAFPEFTVSSTDEPTIQQIIFNGHEAFDKIPAPEPLAVVSFRAMFTNYICHVGMVLLDNKSVIHATEPTGVCIQRLDHPILKHTIYGYYRLDKNSGDID